MLEDEPDEGRPTPRTLLAPAPRDARDRAHDADVGVGAGQPRRVRSRSSTTRSTALPEELRQARWLLKEREEFLAQGPARGRRHHRGRRGCRPSGWSSAPRSCARRAGAAAAGRRRRRGRRPRDCGTRPRTTSTRSSPRSRWCSTARCRRCQKGRERLQVVGRALPEADEPSRRGRRGRGLLRPGRRLSRRPGSTVAGWKSRLTCYDPASAVADRPAPSPGTRRLPAARPRPAHEP